MLRDGVSRAGQSPTLAAGLALRQLAALHDLLLKSNVLDARLTCWLLVRGRDRGRGLRFETPFDFNGAPDCLGKVRERKEAYGLLQEGDLATFSSYWARRDAQRGHLSFNWVLVVPTSRSRGVISYGFSFTDDSDFLQPGTARADRRFLFPDC